MKKLLVTALTLLSCGAAYALPLGNPSEASLMCDGIIFEGYCPDFCQPGVSLCDAISWRVGFYGDYVFNRHLENDSGLVKGKTIEDAELFTNAGYLALNAWDRIDIFTTLGASNLWINTNARGFSGTPGDRLTLESETSFSWSVGGRATVWECGCFAFGVEGQYFRFNGDVTRISVTESLAYYPGSSIAVDYSEWQVGIGVSYRIWNLVPYIGAKYSSAHADFNHATPHVGFSSLVLDELVSRFNGGYVVGVSLVDCERASITIEGRYPDEKAFYVNGQIRF